jgi:small-conductance mechanosensitive channel
MTTPLLALIAQFPLPGADSAGVHIRLPGRWEEWRDTYLQNAGEKIVVFLILALLLYGVAHYVRRQISAQIEDINRRHALRKWTTYGAVTLLALFAVALFADALASFGAVLALTLAGVAVALQDVLKSIVGWLYISGRGGVQIGSRVEVAGVTGDVIDIGVLKTTLVEVGNLVYARQSTGRIVSVPNSRMLTEAVFTSAAENPFVWQEMQVVVTFESDWARGEAILREIGEALHAEIEPYVDRGPRAVERRFAYKYGKTTPIVYVSLLDYGIALTLRYLTYDRARRGTIDRVTRHVLTAFAAEPRVAIAYPTRRTLQLGEGPLAHLGAASFAPEEE